MYSPTLPLIALWFLTSLILSSTVLSSEVQTAIDSLSREQAQLHEQLEQIEAAIDSLRVLPELEEPPASDSAAAWELSSYDWEHEDYLEFLRDHLQGDLSEHHLGSLLDEMSTISIEFRIEREGEEGYGRLRDIEVFDTAGNLLLESRELKSWHVFSRMRDLPADFPEEGVTVSATIDYLSIVDEKVEELTRAVVVNDDIGNVIDAEERHKYDLFAGVQGFVSAAYFRRPDGSYFIRLVTAEEEGEEEKTNNVSLAGIEFVRATIEANR